jgi:hypothetical protein
VIHRAVLAFVVAILITVLGVAPDASAARVVPLAGGGSVVIPRGAVPRGAKLTVRVATKRTGTDFAVAGHRYSLRLRGASRLRHAIRIRLPYDPARVPPTLSPVEVFTVMVYDRSRGGWVALPTRAFRAKHLIVASLIAPLEPAKGRAQQSVSRAGRAGLLGLSFSFASVNDVEQAIGQVLGGRRSPPDCPTSPPNWIQSDEEPTANAPVFACGMTDPGNANVFEYRIANNRTYGVWLTFSTPPDWAWVDGEGWYDQTIKPKVQGFPASQAGELYLPPGEELHAGFPQSSWSDLSITSTPAQETAIAEMATDLVLQLAGTSINGEPRSVLLGIALGTCAKDAASILISHAPAASKIVQMFGSAIPCASSIADPLIKSGARRVAFNAALKVVATAITALSLEQSVNDTVELATHLTWSLGAVARPVAVKPLPPVTPGQPVLTITGACTSSGGTLSGASSGFTPGGHATINAWNPDGSVYANLVHDSVVGGDGSITWKWPCAGDPAGTYSTEAIDNTTGLSSGKVSFTVAAPAPIPPVPTTFAEQQGSHGATTVTNIHNASGVGAKVPAAAWVQVSCKVYDPTIASVNPDGYWYRIASSPWNNAYYAPANTFMNGDPWGGPYTHNTDLAVPNC